MTGDSLRGHIVGGADEGVGVSFGTELATDTKVAKLDLAVTAQQNVGGLDV